MIKKVIFATDFSPLSSRALEYTIGLVRESGFKIVGAFALEPPGSIYPPFEPSSTYSSELEAEARLKLDRFFSSAEGEKGIEIEKRLCTGQPQQILQQLATEEKADLIVVAKHSRSGLEKLFMGSSTEKILRDAQLPVLVVPDLEVRKPKWRSVICATDFSPPSYAAFRFAIQLAQDQAAKLILAHVIDLGSSQASTQRPSQYVESAAEDIRHKLNDAVIDSRAPKNTEVLVMVGKPSTLLVDKARRLGADLVILGKCGHSLMKHRVLGSTTNAILRSASCPVLVVPSQVV